MYARTYEGLAGEYPWILEGVTFASLPDTAARLDWLGDELHRRVDDLPADEAPELAAAVLGSAGVLALRRHGWTVQALPGEPVLCRRGDVGLSPHLMVAGMRDRTTFDRERYDREIEQEGIGDIALADGVPPRRHLGGQGGRHRIDRRPQPHPAPPMRITPARLPSVRRFGGATRGGTDGISHTAATLVVANRTAATPDLLDEVQRRARERPRPSRC